VQSKHIPVNSYVTSIVLARISSGLRIKASAETMKIERIGRGNSVIIGITLLVRSDHNNGQKYPESIIWDIPGGISAQSNFRKRLLFRDEFVEQPHGPVQ
jgi:hypothetical protein